MADEQTTQTNTTTEQETVRRGPGRPRATQAPPIQPQQNAADKERRPSPSVRSRAVALLTRPNVGPAMDSGKLRELAEAREKLLTSRLEAAREHISRYPKSIVAQWKFELSHLVNGTWVPGIKAPKGAMATTAESIIGAPRSQRDISVTTPSDRNIDAILDEAQ